MIVNEKKNAEETHTRQGIHRASPACQRHRQDLRVHVHFSIGFKLALVLARLHLLAFPCPVVHVPVLRQGKRPTKIPLRPVWILFIR